MVSMRAGNFVYCVYGEMVCVVCAVVVVSARLSLLEKNIL